MTVRCGVSPDAAVRGDRTERRQRGSLIRPIGNPGSGLRSDPPVCLPRAGRRYRRRLASGNGLGQTHMRRFTGAERQKRLELARDAALQLVRPEGNVEIGGELQRIAGFRHNSVAIAYLSPRPGSWKSHLSDDP